ncbi:DUF4811 domain-containing protein [Secundilactobacillus silagei]|uniref:DUF4811 domain-containing protein n=1 Tax=Secundilactobacillus silagei JCM 19001 TaxID=1302250 RepID=A0A1Z5IFZ4_9LACO|nr:DUF4811 domain-containing protein [Secundilactobacillus silagei]TDG73282.1 hypothetical protein C5L25_000431 [Secundilactobacillus silagei JCM 19001]GAX00653.1 hypothetical protein IWT126_00668 [Secundilactobacillus silagei JCM 19001]
MILVAIGIFAVLAFIFCIYIEKTGLSVTLTTLALLGLVVSSVYAVKNWQHHYGLEQYTTTTTRNIYSVSPNKQMSMILYQPIGSKNNHQVYIYKQNENDKKPVHTQANSDTKNKLSRISGTTQMTTTVTRWRYKNNAAKFWFAFTGENHKFVKRTNKIEVNKNWLVLSVAQSKALQKQMKSKTYQAQLKQQGKAFVMKGMKAAMMKNPTMSPADQAKLQKQLTGEFQAQAMQKMIKSVQK